MTVAVWQSWHMRCIPQDQGLVHSVFKMKSARPRILGLITLLLCTWWLDLLQLAGLLAI